MCRSHSTYEIFLEKKLILRLISEMLHETLFCFLQIFAKISRNISYIFFCRIIYMALEQNVQKHVTKCFYSVTWNIRMIYPESHLLHFTKLFTNMESFLFQIIFVCKIWEVNLIVNFDIYRCEQCIYYLGPLPANSTQHLSLAVIYIFKKII